MQKPHKHQKTTPDTPQAPDHGFYDPAPTEEDDLWFLPGPAPDDVVAHVRGRVITTAGGQTETETNNLTKPSTGPS